MHWKGLFRGLLKALSWYLHGETE